MTPLQQRFVAEYRVSRNATQSAIRAGYSARNASAIASRLLRVPGVIEALRAAGVEIVHGVRPPGQIQTPYPPYARKHLTPKQLAFVAEYQVSRNATQAAYRAGYGSRHCGTIGSALLHVPAVAAALATAGVAIPVGVHPCDQQRQPQPPFKKRGLTLLQERFVMEYLVDGNATQAAIRSGLPSRSPESAGTKMLHRPAVAAAIARERAAGAARIRVSTERVLTEMARIAFSDIGAIADWDDDGLTLKPKAEISAHDRAAIMEIRSRRGESGPDTHIRLHSKRYAIDGLARHLGIYGRGAQTIAALTEPADNAQAARDALRKALTRFVHDRTPQAEAAPDKPKAE